MPIVAWENGIVYNRSVLKYINLYSIERKVLAT